MGLKRMRRATITTPAAVTGVRDFTYDDGAEFDMTGGDDAPVGDPVKMKDGPYDVGFELLGPLAAIVTGYCASLVVAGKVITVTAGVETVATRTLTFTDGYFVVGESYPTEGAGRVPVKGSFKTFGAAEA